MTLSGQGYICSAGESFDSVALSVYGDEAFAADLLNANPELCLKMVFDGGEILRLPVVETVTDASGMETAPEVAPWKTL